jgi:hypothetical protein
MHVVYKSFDSESMTVPWIVAEPGNFTDSKGNVRASVGGEIEQHHANNRPVAPICFLPCGFYWGQYQEWIVQHASSCNLSGMSAASLIVWIRQ